MVPLTLKRHPAGLRSAVAAAGYLVLITRPMVVAGAGVNLNGGQIAGVVLGSVGGALLLALLTCLLCYMRAQRGRQTGDLTWAKTADLEAAGTPGHTPHQPLPDAPSSERNTTTANITAAAGSSNGGAAPQPDSLGPAAGVRAGTGSGHPSPGVEGAQPQTPGSDSRSPGWGPDGPTASLEAFRASPSEGVEYKRISSRGRSTGGGFAGLLGAGRGLLRSGVKDKHLEVSRSARVEPSAEVQMTEPFEPAATNMGPPLSKSSMLLRWLQGADDGHAEAVAAQLAAEAAAAGGAAAAAGVGGAGGGLRASRAHTVGGLAGAAGGVGGANLFSDRLPLLSLAAQQTGIVWSKMPPSVASSPAVSLAESSSMHMLKGTLKRSDAHDDLLPHAHSNKTTASAGSSGPAAAAAAAAAGRHHAHGGDDRYPPSLAFASVEALRKRNSLQQDRPGIVFDYVTTTPVPSRAATSGGAPSRVPTIGGAVLPLPPVEVSAGGASSQAGSGGSNGGGNPGVLAVAAAAAAAAMGAVAGERRQEPEVDLAAGLLPLSTPAVSGLDGDGALLGSMPDAHVFAKVLAAQQHQQQVMAARMDAPAPSTPPPPPQSQQQNQQQNQQHPYQRSSGVWLHQTPPTKLSALQEADGEGEAGEGEVDRDGGDGGSAPADGQGGHVGCFDTPPRHAPRPTLSSQCRTDTPSSSSPHPKTGLSFTPSVSPSSSSSASLTAAAAAHATTASPASLHGSAAGPSPADAPASAAPAAAATAAPPPAAAAAAATAYPRTRLHSAPPSATRHGHGGAAASGAAAELQQARSGWTCFSEGDGWPGGYGAGGGAATEQYGGLSPYASPGPLSGQGHAVLSNGTSLASPLSPFLPHPPGDGMSAPALGEATDGHVAVSGNGATQPLASSAKEDVVRSGFAAAAAAGGGSSSGSSSTDGGIVVRGGGGGLHHIALRANSSIVDGGGAVQGLATDAAVRTSLSSTADGVPGATTGDASNRVAATSGLVTAAAPAAPAPSPASSRIFAAAPHPSLRSRVPAPAPVQPPSHSASLRSMRSLTSVSPSMSVHFPDVPASWGDVGTGLSPAVSASAEALEGPSAAATAAAAAAPPALVLPVARSGKVVPRDEKAQAMEQLANGRAQGPSGGGAVAARRSSGEARPADRATETEVA